MIRSKRAKEIVIVAVTCLFASGAGLFVFSEGSCSCKTSENILSPNGGLKAFYETKDCGATTSSVYKVFISNIDGSSQEQVLKASSLDKIDIVWKDEGTVDISTDSLKIYHFQNFWNDKGRSIFIKLNNYQ